MATNVGGLPEMVKHKQFGRIIEPKDPIVLAREIVDMYKNSTELNNYVNNIGKQYHSGYMSWEIIAEELLQIYKSSSQL